MANIVKLSPLNKTKNIFVTKKAHNSSHLVTNRYTLVVGCPLIRFNNVGQSLGHGGHKFLQKVAP